MLNNSGPRRLGIRVVDCGVALEIGEIKHFGLKADGAIREGAERIAEIRVNRPGVDHALRESVQLFLLFQIIYAKPHLNAVQHPLHHPGVAAHRNTLIQGIEVVIVKRQAHRQAFDDKGRKVFACPPPLFLGIAFYQLLIHIAANQRDGLFLKILRLADNLLPLLRDFCLSFLRRDNSPHSVKGIHIKREAEKLSLIICYRRIRKPVEVGKTPHIIPYGFVIGMEDMRAVLMDVDAFDLFGVDISGDVGTFVNHKDSFAGICELAGSCGSVEA